MTARRSPDGWTVVSYLFLVSLLFALSRPMLSIMMPNWEAEFGWSREFVSSGIAVVLAVQALSSPIAGYLIDRVGPKYTYAAGTLLLGASIALATAMSAQWQFIVLVCALGGFGVGALSLPQASSTIARYFEDGRGFAIGMGASGATAGQLIMVPFLTFLIGAIGWRTALGLYAAIVVAVGLVGWILLGRARPVASALHAARTAGPLGTRLAMITGGPTFWLILAAFAICGFTTAGMAYTHLIPYAIACGFTPMQGSTAFGALCAFNMGGIILFGWLADRVHRPTLFAAMFIMRAVAFVLLLNIQDNPALLFLFAALFGLTDIASLPIVGAMIARYFGVGVMGLAFGLLFAGHSIGGALGAYAGGAIFDAFARYEWAWILALGLALLAAVFALMIQERRAPSALAPQPA
jgi:MFS family permease